MKRIALGMVLGIAPTLVWAAPPTELPPPPDPPETGTGVEPTGLEVDPEAEALLLEQAFEEHLAKARAAERKEEWRSAIREYQAALKLRDNDPESLRGLGHARKARTKPNACPRRAIENLMLLEIYDPKGLWVSERRHALDWMGECGDVYRPDRLELASELAGLAPGALGRPDDVHVTVAELLIVTAEKAKTPEKRKDGQERALGHLATYKEESQAAGTPQNANALWLRGEINREMGETGSAIDSYRKLIELYPDDERAKPAEAWVSELEIEFEVAELSEKQGGRPTPEAEDAYRRGNQALRDGSLARAQAEFSNAVAESPWFPQAHYQLGQVYAREEKFPDAIKAFRTAIAMEPYDHAAHMALGLLYYKKFRGAEDEQARKHLDRALRLRPDLYELHNYLGELYAREGDREQARDHFEAYLEALPTGDPGRVAAREALRDLDRETTETEVEITPPPRAELRLLDPELQRLINQAYVVGAMHGDWDRAEDELLKARDSFPGEPALLNELAKVVYAQGRLGDARSYWEESLALDNEQQEVHERLGLLMMDNDPSRALTHLRKAADLGSLTARFALATKLWEGWTSLWDAQRELEMYLREAGPYDLNWDRGQALQERMRTVFLRIYLAAAGLAFLILLFPTWRLYRRFRGASLGQLLERDPSSFPEVARILSLIRHEILKHNTAFMSDVGEALALGAPDADARSTLLARRLFGDSKASTEIERLAAESGERQGIYGRFLDYCAELERVGRAHGVRLNLYRKDPIFSSMLRAFEDVAERANWLANPTNLRSGRRLELARTLGRSGHVLGRKAFERLSGLIQRLCIVDVTPELIESVFARVSREDQFERLAVAPLVVEGPTLSIRIFLRDLEDILTNVIRNSLKSSAQYADAPVTLGIDLVEELDEITGLESLAVRVKDRSKERLTNEMLRGRYVERGMGITADLLSRYDGSIAVEHEPGWEKAVVLRFFALEHADR